MKETNKTTRSKTGTYLFLAGLTLLTSAVTGSAATTVFSETFTSTGISQQPNPYYGGWYTPQLAAGTWYGPAEASITVGTLQVNPTFGTRFGGILLNPNTMAGAGDYTLVFDLVSFTGDSNDFTTINLWTGQGYDLSLGSANGLILNNLTGVLGTNGSASATLQGSLSPTSSGTYSIPFTYDGAGTGGWPFPQAQYDNISLTKADAIPEPSTGILALVATLGLFRRRR